MASHDTGHVYTSSDLRSSALLRSVDWQLVTDYNII